MFSNLLGRFWSDLPSSFGYVLNPSSDKVFQEGDVRGKSTVFQVAYGTSKATKAPVTFFIYSTQPTTRETERYLPFARNALQRWKQLRHPNILKYLDGIEVSSGIYIVAEHATPLSALPEVFSSDFSWGLHQVAGGLKFMHEDCKLVHGLISPNTIFSVSETGDWKLACFDVSCQCFRTRPGAPPGNQPTTLASEHLPPLDSLRDILERIKLHSAGPIAFVADRGSDFAYLPSCNATSIQNSPFFVDRLGFAVTAAWLFAASQPRPPSSARNIISGVPLPTIDFSTNLKYVAKNFQAALTRLADESTAHLLGVGWSTLIKQCTFFSESQLTQVLLFCDQISLKGAWDKEVFFQTTLPAALTDNQIPPIIQIKKLLPVITHQLGIATPSLVPHLIRIFVAIAGFVDQPSLFATAVSPVLIQLFRINDRCTRFLLLQTMAAYSAKIPPDLASSLLDPILVGFADSSVELRDATLRGVLMLTPILAKSNASAVDKIFRQTNKLLTSDPEAAIRTNVVVCYNKFAEDKNNIPDGIIAKCVAPALVVALRDPFAPCKLAALQSLVSCVRVLTPYDIATKYFGPVACKLADPEVDVRNAAFHACEYLLSYMKPFVEGIPQPAPTTEHGMTSLLNESQSLQNTVLGLLKKATMATTERFETVVMPSSAVLPGQMAAEGSNNKTTQGPPRIIIRGQSQGSAESVEGSNSSRKPDGRRESITHSAISGADSAIENIAFSDALEQEIDALIRPDDDEDDWLTNALNNNEAPEDIPNDDSLSSEDPSNRREETFSYSAKTSIVHTETTRSCRPETAPRAGGSGNRSADNKPEFENDARSKLLQSRLAMHESDMQKGKSSEEAFWADFNSQKTNSSSPTDPSGLGKPNANFADYGPSEKSKTLSALKKTKRKTLVNT